MEVTQAMLEAAMKEAVRRGVFPKAVDEDSYLKNWAAMKACLQVALDTEDTVGAKE